MASQYVQDLARTLGLHVSTWSPGDGVTRYRFHREEQDYNSGNEIGTVAGRRDAILWLHGYQAARSFFCAFADGEGGVS